MEASVAEKPRLEPPIDPSPSSSTPRPARLAPRAGLAVLLVATAAAYLWRITDSAMANNFYAGAAWSATRDAKAWLFGSVDPANFITVDKPPLALWVMGLSGRLFGFSSASMLVPQALMAVAAVGLLYAAVTRITRNDVAGLLAGAVLAVTPVVALMFRFNNPDAAMVLLMTAAAYCVIRALPRADARWLALAGVALGFAFLAKMLEGLLALPALALVYLVAAPIALGRRVIHLAIAALALIVSSGWYVLLTVLWPASSRPYIAGSTDNSFMDLVLGYNGFGRFLGNQEIGGQTPLPPGYRVPTQLLNSFNDFGSAGPARLFLGESGFQISWLVPAALVALVLVLASRWRAPRTDEIRAAALLFGVWLILVGAALSAMTSAEHAYYSLAIAPAVAGTLGVGVAELWRRRDEAFGRLGAAAVVLAAGVWSFVVLQRNADWQPAVRWLVLAVTAGAALGLVVTALVRSFDRVRAGAAAVLVVVGLIAGLGGSTAYAAATLPQAHTGRSPVVGPPPPPETGFQAIVKAQLRNFADGTAFTDPRIVDRLRHSDATWSAAVERSSIAAAMELASHTAVLAVGGFAGDDPVPSLGRFQQLVDDHRIGYYVTQEMRLPPTWRYDPSAPLVTTPWAQATHRDIADWVAAHFQVTRIGGVAVYDLNAPLR
ncbi:glycosyltransferase family 39 protein [Nocardia sp. CDC159]|uniref:Glycosyltransferase family 39 protein n=1 Tax=Nocardia pulmonis TaxID=2951408 RepID=A0A9X2E5H7_9NOCA|nr:MULTISPECIES: glycosyltransferase family 39 protein [Nocardia]MCM6773205.1 glycosyltransferase family 39 protein [Nocardia pulmonis]MCM6786092.1 glycosyltransferase family 39 protein [Nocardia sp. CDC159]